MHARMTRLTDTKRQPGRPRLRSLPSSHRLAVDGEGAVTHIRNMKWAPNVCEAQCSAQGPSNEASSLDMILAIWKQRVRSIGSCFLLVRTLFFLRHQNWIQTHLREKLSLLGPIMENDDKNKRTTESRGSSNMPGPLSGCRLCFPL